MVNSKVEYADEGDDKYPVGFKCDVELYHMLKLCSENKDITQWNEWVKKNIGTEKYLQGADLSGMYLQDAVFFYVHFESANFDGACLSGASFHHAYCDGASFCHAYCDDTISNDLSKGIDFSYSSCRRADFKSAICTNSRFTGAHCEEACFLKAHCDRATFWGAHCDRATFWGAHCEYADFTATQFQDATFMYAHCENASFTGTHCIQTKFIGTHLQEARFDNTNLDDSSFRNSDISGTYFNNVWVNQHTNFYKCIINDSTIFINTSPSSIITDYGTRAKLEQNVRKHAWESWYKTQNCLKAFIIKRFWDISDYGYSTMRILKYFFLFIFLFTMLYTLFSGLLNEESAIVGETFLGRFFRMGAFATATMVTLGFSNINVHMTACSVSYAGTFVVTCNLLVGYFMLAVLVTRLGILFQNMGPESETALQKSQFRRTMEAIFIKCKYVRNKGKDCADNLSTYARKLRCVVNRKKQSAKNKNSGWNFCHCTVWLLAHFARWLLTCARTIKNSLRSVALHEKTLSRLDAKQR